MFTFIRLWRIMPVEETSCMENIGMNCPASANIAMACKRNVSCFGAEGWRMVMSDHPGVQARLKVANLEARVPLRLIFSLIKTSRSTLE